MNPNNLLDGATQTGGAGSIIIFGILLVVIVGLFIWSGISNKKKQKAAQDMVNTLKIGDRVKTIGGVCGFVAEINNEENTFVLETGTEDKKSYVKFDKGAIYQTAPKEGSAVAAANAKKQEVNKAEKEEKADKEEIKEEVKETKEEKNLEDKDWNQI